MIVKESKLVFELGFSLSAKDATVVFTGLRAFDERSYVVCRMVVMSKLLGQISKSRYVWLPVVDGSVDGKRCMPVFNRSTRPYTFPETTFSELSRRFLVSDSWMLVPYDFKASSLRTSDDYYRFR